MISSLSGNGEQTPQAVSGSEQEVNRGTIQLVIYGQLFYPVDDGLTASATNNVPALAIDTALYFAFGLFIDDARFYTTTPDIAADMSTGHYRRSTVQ